MSLSELLQSLEEQLLDPAVRRSPEVLAELLTEDFREFGSSGRVFTKAQIIEALSQEGPYIRPFISGFEAELLAQGVALVTYRIVRPDKDGQLGTVSLRSSIWVLREDRWQILFHQGTPIPKQNLP